MNVARPIFFLLLLLSAVFSSAAREPTEDEEVLDIQAIKPGEVHYDYGKTGIVVITNDFVVRYKGAVLTAQHGRLNTTNGDVVAVGDSARTRLRGRCGGRPPRRGARGRRRPGFRRFDSV